MKTIRSFRTLLFRLLLLMAITASSAAAQTTASNEWTWIGGSDTVGQPGIYGTMGTPAATNVPGSRVQATRWTDKNGNLWLLGGWGFDADGNLGDLNDLWKFNLATNEWTWMNGSSVMACGLDTCVGPGSYGTLGTPAPGNAPGGRRSAASWIDRSGNLWLFGGLYLDANTEEEEEFNDLWEFNTATNEWSWMGGSGAPDVNAGYPGIYGTLGIPATSNIPGSRFGASYWTDSSGNFWLFGGFGMDSVGDPSDFGDLNDLWEFNPSTNEWTWMGGSNTIPNSGGQVGVYGTLGMPAAGNIPGSRYNTTCWTDSQGDFWLLGGLGFDSTGYWGDEGSLNDLWKLNPTANEWTWMGGSSVIGPNDEVTGVYGTIGIPAATITPSGASASTTLTIATSATTASLRSNRRPLFPTALVAALFCFGFKKRRRLQTLLLLTVSLIGLGLLNGCGGGSSGSTSGGGKSQSVTSTINVTATSGSLQHTAAISLTVN
jgi:N-acetylneuraminic acid mutarotase